MRTLIYICIAFVLLSCARTVYVPIETTRTVTTTVVDTFVEIVTPSERVVNVTTDTTSTIKTLYATSTAVVSNGILTHEIMQHERKDSVMTQTVYVHTTDSVPYPVAVTEAITPEWCWPVIITLIIALCISMVLVFIGFR